MPYYDNPAGRLHDLLVRLSAQNRKNSLLRAWADVLGVDQDDVVLHLGGVADLVRQIQEAVDRLGDSILRDPVVRLRETWSRPIFPRDQAFKQTLEGVLPGAEPLETLGLVAAQLHVLAPEGEVPDEVRRGELTQQVRDLADAVRHSEDLPNEVKEAILARLRDVENAIERIYLGGPGAVRRAMEAVMGTVVRSAVVNPSAARTPSLNQVFAAMAAMWVVFTSGDELQKNLEAWPKVVHAIATGEVVEDSKVEDAGGSSKEDDASDRERGSRTQGKSKTSK